jgi:Flp pilus assembly pilin Flp
MRKFLAQLARDEAGATLIESAVMWGVVACAVLGGLSDNSGAIGSNLSQLATTFNLR